MYNKDMKKVKNISAQEFTVGKVGLVKPDQIIEVNDNFNNANFAEVGNETVKENKGKNLEEDKKTDEVEVEEDKKNNKKNK